MENTFHGLPPLKRFKLQQKTPIPQNIPTPDSCLPAKKRIRSRSPPTSYCLPAKKRVWALQPLPVTFNTIQDDPPIQPEKPTKDIPSNDFNRKLRNQADHIDLNEAPFDDEAKEEEEDGIICSVCQSTDGDPTDPIVFCDGCDLMVHASCYGNPLVRAIPEGDWFCSRCEILKAKSKKESGCLDCCLCPLKGGAIKPTVDGRWAHIMCALLVPEVFFRDSEGREGIDYSRVPSRRWKGVCYVCNSKRGCVIECSEPKCSSAFHVSCGLNEELCIEYREGKAGAIVAGFCNIHTQLWKKQQQTGKFKIVPRDGNMEG